MKTERNIFIAFILNLFFSIFEFFGGIFTGSVAIISDSIHDFGDAISIGFSYFFEKKSKKKPDNKYTYGYIRYSIIGTLFTVTVLLLGSILVIYNSILKIMNPVEINYDGMIIFGVVGVVLNLIAAIITNGGHSLNQKVVSLHMLEDVLGWLVVLIGAIIMRFTDFSLLDPIMSIGVALFIMYEAIKTLIEASNIILEKTPKGINIEEIKKHLLSIDGIEDVHHIHIWSMDSEINYSTMHVVSHIDPITLKKLVKDELKEFGIEHSTIEIESSIDECMEKECVVRSTSHIHHHHHH